ncbi:MAG TPA: hypothetical protein VK713_02770, partial [Actinomycetes bacterium]|nr:hypothetical protein [Actinomycetes bacterium]
AETIRLETLRHRSLEQLGRVYGHLESVLDEVRIGIGRVEEEQEDQDEATAAAAARLGVEPPAASPEESPRFPAPRVSDGDADGDESGDRADDAAEGMLSATRPDTPATDDPPDRDAEAPQRVPAADTADTADTADSGETTQATLPGASSTDTTETTPAVAETETPPDAPTDGEPPANGERAANGERPANGQDVTQQLEPVGNAAKGRPDKPSPKEDKG